MVIAGIDFSITSPGIVCFKVDESMNVFKSEWFGVAKTQKQISPNLIHLKKDLFKSDIQRFIAIAEYIAGSLEKFADGDVDLYVALEGYAMNAKGLVFNIAEATGLLKERLWDMGTKLRIYEPTSIKKFAALNGSCDKVFMGEAFDSCGYIHKPMLGDLPLYESPRADIVDAFWAAQLLLTEMKLRLGLLELKSLKPKQIEVFNATSKAHKDNIMTRDFIVK